MKFDNTTYVYPWIENAQLVISINDDEDNQAINLTQLFGEYMSYLRLMDGSIALEHHKEVRNTIALLRLIAREMETELEGSRE